MTPMKRLMLVISVGILLLALVVFIVYPLFRSDEPAEVVVEPDPVTKLQPLPPDQPVAITEEQVVIEPLNGEVAEKDEVAARAEVERLTRLFVERFGSYSNFSNFANISSLEAFMTSSMLNYSQGFISDNVNTSPVSGYYGVTTTLIGLKVVKLNLGSSAVVNIIVQEDVQDGLDGEVIKVHKDGRVEFRYSGGKWLVHGLYYN